MLSLELVAASSSALTATLHCVAGSSSGQLVCQVHLLAVADIVQKVPFSGMSIFLQQSPPLRTWSAELPAQRLSCACAAV
jgi:hypothetical protein